MKKTIMGVLLLTAFIFAANISEAQTQLTQKNQQHRIQEGVKHGKLTRNEAHNLRMQQAHIKRMKRAAMADGYTSPKEKMRIRQARQKANRDIYIQKHDRQKRF